MSRHIPETKQDTNRSTPSLTQNPSPKDSTPIILTLPKQLHKQRWSRSAEEARESLPRDIRPRLNRSALNVGTLEVAWAEYQDYLLQDENNIQRALVLDFTNASYIIGGVLPYLGALLKHRSDQNLDTKLKLPTAHKRGQSPRIIDYLRTWHFGEFVEQITGRNIHDFLTEDTLTKWQEWKPDNSIYTSLINSPIGKEQLLSNEYLRLTRLESSIQMPNRDEIAEIDARHIAGRITSSRVQQISLDIVSTLLREYLGYQTDRWSAEVVGDIIYRELLVNSLIHSTGRNIYTYGQFQNTDSIGNPGRHFVLSVWDDGQSIGDTLRTACNHGPITGPAHAHIKERIHILNENTPTQEVILTPLQNIEARIKNVPGFASIGALLAGVSSQPAINTSPNPQTGTIDPPALRELSQYSGLGLFRLRSAAVSQLMGRIEYASGGERLYITAPGDDACSTQGEPDTTSDADTAVTGSRNAIETFAIYQRLTDTWPISGNLWTVWLPVNPDLCMQTEGK